MTIIKEYHRDTPPLELCFAGGNHLAHILVTNLGADFAETYPYWADADDARACIPTPDLRDVWSAWACIMTARDKANDA